MKRLYLVILVSFLFLVGCESFRDKSSEWFYEPEVNKMQEKVQMEILINPVDIPGGETPEELILSRAEKKGMAKINSKWIRGKPLVKGSNSMAYDAQESNFISRDSRFVAEYIEDAELFSKFVQVKAECYFIEQVCGIITRIGDDRILAGQKDEIEIEMLNLTPNSKGAYFLVAHPEELNDRLYLRVIGSGKIYNTTSDSMVQGRLLETSSEISPNDLIFLVSVRVDPLAAQDVQGYESMQSTVNATATGYPNATEIKDEDVIMVEPEEEPAKTQVEPAEPK